MKFIGSIRSAFSPVPQSNTVLVCLSLFCFLHSRPSLPAFVETYMHRQLYRLHVTLLQLCESQDLTSRQFKVSLKLFCPTSAATFIILTDCSHVHELLWRCSKIYTTIYLLVYCLFCLSPNVGSSVYLTGNMHNLFTEYNNCHSDSHDTFDFLQNHTC